MGGAVLRLFAVFLSGDPSFNPIAATGVSVVNNYAWFIHVPGKKHMVIKVPTLLEHFLLKSDNKMTNFFTNQRKKGIIGRKKLGGRNLLHFVCYGPNSDVCRKEKEKRNWVKLTKSHLLLFL
ncbi:hypothetical protein XELAEV_18015526mg [Xenopus laevis]|uniref:Uncharacterized protein n=1 Tax=Xenopus laevis TaxID=8355 RepID=A0A974DK00_XENLA|nr:hypothetical protein XELAEV_18015526mg [Xenopus laevis]